MQDNRVYLQASRQETKTYQTFDYLHMQRPSHSCMAPWPSWPCTCLSTDVMHARHVQVKRWNLCMCIPALSICKWIYAWYCRQGARKCKLSCFCVRRSAPCTKMQRKTQEAGSLLKMGFALDTGEPANSSGTRWTLLKLGLDGFWLVQKLAIAATTSSTFKANAQKKTAYSESHLLNKAYIFHPQYLDCNISSYLFLSSDRN
jgi:hypothetical protein